MMKSVLRRNDEPIKTWLNKFPESQRDFIQDALDQIAAFSQGIHQQFFQGCGLYAVGSSVTNQSHNDVDIVLVGLDFRAVIDYDNIFLMDKETLIKEGIVVPPYKFVVLQEKEGEPTLLQRASEVTPLDAYMFMGFEYQNQQYEYDFERLKGDALNLLNYCARKSSQSSLVNALHHHLKENLAAALGDISDPFEPYFHEQDFFLTTRFGIYPFNRNSTPRTPVPQELKLPFPLIDFIIHAENLTTESWKRHQQNYGMSFIPLYEWPEQEKAERPVLTCLPLPEFIDKKGLQRVRWHPFFTYLKEPPINVQYQETPPKSF